MDIDALDEINRVAEEVNSCRLCKLSYTRRRAVPGEGNPRAEVVLVGEAPGEREDELGRPFVGAAGELLNRILGSLGVRRSDLFITNVVKCRPPNNREPEPDEVNACSPYLIRQLCAIRPRIVVALGRVSASFLLSLMGKRFRSLSDVRGRFYTVKLPCDHTFKLLVTYHPAAVLRNPKLRSYLEADLRMVFANERRVGLEEWLSGGNS